MDTLHEGVLKGSGMDGLSPNLAHHININVFRILYSCSITYKNIKFLLNIVILGGIFSFDFYVTCSNYIVSAII